MQVKTNLFLEAIRAGRPQLGLWVSMGSSLSAEIIAGADFDWVMLDMEHTHTELNELVGQLQVFDAHRTTSLVRPPWNDSVMVKRILDSGAPGLLFPMIQSVEEARAAVEACRYPPRGIRGVAGVHRGSGFGRMKDYFDRIEDETAILLQAETRAAVEQVEAYAEIDGVDGIFFGPADIATDIGHLAQPMHPDVWDLVLPAARKLIAKGVPVGTLVLDKDFAQKLLDEGFTFVAVGTDVALLKNASDALRGSFKT